MKCALLGIVAFAASIPVGNLLDDLGFIHGLGIIALLFAVESLVLPVIPPSRSR